MQTSLYNLATDKYCGFIAGIIKYFLWLLSLVYGLIVRILILCSQFKSYRLNCKVISVGNITLGGTGKTSLVEYIARYLKTQGHKVAILSRGYKRSGCRLSVVCCRPNTEHRTPNTETMGDEPYMLAKKLGDIPVIVDSDRIRAAKKAIRDYQVDTVILDDGFQQWKLKKDLEIAAIDSTNPFGNRQLLPRGILREPLSALKRADVFILTKTNIVAETDKITGFLNRVNPQAVIYESAHKPVGFYRIDKTNELLGRETFRGKTVALFSGIGSPDSFENLISSLGINIGLAFRFRDHHHYTKADLEKIMKNSEDKNIEVIITTEKDSVRLYRLPIADYRLPIFFLRIELAVTKDEQGFFNRLLRMYSP